jgi:hypothetical protein
MVECTGGMEASGRRNWRKTPTVGPFCLFGNEVDTQSHYAHISRTRVARGVQMSKLPAPLLVDTEDPGISALVDHQAVSLAAFCLTVQSVASTRLL